MGCLITEVTSTPGGRPITTFAHRATALFPAMRAPQIMFKHVTALTPQSA
jgi:hypothetical protein